MQMNRIVQKIPYVKNKDELRGYEGIAARYYFHEISGLLREEFRFQNRSRRPPKDPFNSALSFGYTLLFYEIMCFIEQRGLSPYIGFLHEDKERHPTLVSDLMEEWRPILIDAITYHFMNKTNTDLEDFMQTDTGVYLTNPAIHRYLEMYYDKMLTSTKYLRYDNEKMGYRRALQFQVSKFLEAIQSVNPDVYHAVHAR